MPPTPTDREPPPLRGCLVTGTDTGVGKTIVAAAIAAALRADGVRVAACKPVVTGVDEPDPSGAPADHELLAACTGQTPGDVTAATFGAAVSPHLAAADAGTPLDPDALLQNARAVAATADVLVAEGVGGLLVPLTPQWSVCDYAAALGLPLVVVARPGLGTINHTCLTVTVARAAGLRVRGIVLNPWPPAPTAMERDNARTIAALTGVRVWTLAQVVGLTPDALAAAAAAWPIGDWIA
ncbi:MAG: dethiobiotin synthase [Solirubrobacterales bacterium]|nr:dethiobiotin synthase [Solirubrobacterales bacterium]